MKKIESLVSFLNKKKFYKEAKYLKKISAPLVEGAGIFDISGEKPDEDSPFQEGRVHTKTIGHWYDSVRNLGQNIIIVQFDSGKMDKEARDKIKKIELNQSSMPLQGLAEQHSYEGGYEKITSIQDFFQDFPKLKNSITKELKKTNNSIRYSDILIVLYDKNTEDSISFSPKYFGHDIGHIDTDGAINSSFSYDLIYLLMQIGKFYINANADDQESYAKDWDEDSEESSEEESSEEESSYDFEEDEYDEMQYLENYNEFEDSSVFNTFSDVIEYLDGEAGVDFALNQLENFFELYSRKEDYSPDIYSYILDGSFMYKLNNPPSQINFTDTPDGSMISFILKGGEESKTKIKELVSKFEDDQLKRIRDDVENGPLTNFKGKVILYT